MITAIVLASIGITFHIIRDEIEKRLAEDGDFVPGDSGDPDSLD